MNSREKNLEAIAQESMALLRRLYSKMDIEERHLARKLGLLGEIWKIPGVTLDSVKEDK